DPAGGDESNLVASRCHARAAIGSAGLHPWPRTQLLVVETLVAATVIGVFRSSAAGRWSAPVNPSFCAGHYPELAAISSQSRAVCFPVQPASCFAQPVSYGADIRPIARRCWNFHSPFTLT